MANIDRELSVLTSQLQKSHVEDQGLSFSGRTLKLNTEKDAEVVTDEIDKCDNLISLNFDGNTVGIDAAKRIAESLRKHGEFKRAIWKNMFTGRTKEEIPPALTHLGSGIISAKASLVELDLSDNAFGPIGVEGLSNLIQSPSFYSLQELRLNNNGLGITGGKLLAKALLKCYESSGKKFALRVFQAGRNRLENVGAEALAKVFKMIGTLVEVSMPQNGIYAPGITALSEAFKNNPHLKILNFNDNTVGKKGAAALARALPCLQNLETLNLGDCLLKTAGAVLIAQALSAKHSNLQNLILEHNEINLKGGIEVVKAMQAKSLLMVLNLNGNNFGIHGIEKIKDNLKINERPDAIQSFSEDEGSEEENEENDSDGDDESSQNEEDTDSCSSKDDSNVGITKKSDEIASSKTTVPEFLAVSSCNNFVNLGINKFEQFISYIETSENEDFIKNTLTTLLAVSSLCENNRQNVQTEAVSCSLRLYKYLFDWAVKKNKLSLVTNAVLVQLRLIKTEEKNALIDCDRNTCINLLRLAMNEENIIPKSSCEMICMFVGKRSPCTINASGDVSTVQ